MTTSRWILTLALAGSAFGADLLRAPHLAAQTEAGGTGPYAVIYEEDPTLPGQVVYRPADLGAVGEGALGLYLFGNGACKADGTDALNHMVEIASHGYVAVAPGIIPGPDRPAPQAAARAEGRLATDTPADALTQALDWALAENEREGSPYRGRIDGDRVAVSGWSCGGLQALLAATDPRVRTSVIMYSGLFNDGGNPIAGIEVDKSLLERIHGSVLYVLGSPTDMAHPNGMDDFRRIEGRQAAVVNIPVGHGGTFAGLGAEVTVAWLKWQLEGDSQAGARFSGAECGYCQDDRLTIERKGID